MHFNILLSDLSAAQGWNPMNRSQASTLATVTKALKLTHQTFSGLFGVSREALWTNVGGNGSKYLEALGFWCRQFHTVAQYVAADPMHDL